MIDMTNSYALSFWAGKKVGDLATLLVASPGILLDKAVTNTKKYNLKTSHAPRILTDLFLSGQERQYYEDDDDKVLYTGGFFSKYPLGNVAQAVGFTTNAAVSATLALSATLTYAALFAAGATALLALSIAAIIISTAILAVRSCIVGPHEAVGEFKRIMA